LRPGDRVAIRSPQRSLVVEVLRVPEKQLSRQVAATFYTKIEESGPDETDDDR
jgi:ribosomal 50S subunit-recycling heat shock protein